MIRTSGHNSFKTLSLIQCGATISCSMYMCMLVYYNMETFCNL